MALRELLSRLEPWKPLLYAMGLALLMWLLYPSRRLGAEILLDAVNRCRRGCAHEARLELLAMRMIVDPFARGGHPLAGGDHRCVADDGDQFTMAAGLESDDTKSVLGVVVGDTLDEAGQRFLG